MEEKVPEEVVAAIAAAIALYLEEEGSGRDDVPLERRDAGLFREIGLIELMRRQGRSR